MQSDMRCLLVKAAVLMSALGATRGQVDTTMRPITPLTNDTEQNGAVKITEEECMEMLEKHNKYRKQHNANPLEIDDEASIIVTILEGGECV